MSVPLSIFIYITIILGFVSYLDLKYRKIPNLWPSLNIISFIFINIFFPELDFVSINSFFVPVIIILIGIVLFKYNIMGGGDSKFLATMMLLIHHELHLSFLYTLSWVTAIFAFFRIIFLLIKNKEINRNNFLILIPRALSGKKFPYAPIILLSWIIFRWEIY